MEIIMKITEAIRKRRIYFDGGTGTCLQSAGLPSGTPPEVWNLERPEKIRALHEEYLNAGADIIKTNTFGVNPLKYENYAEYINAALAIARSAIGSRRDKYIALDIGPSGKLLKPLGDLDFEVAVESFSRIAELAESGGADLILIETMNDSYETKAAVLGAKEGSSLPIFVTCVYDERGKLMTGADPESMIAMLEGLGVSAIGMNCSLGPDKMLVHLDKFLESSSLPIIMNPNAGLPEVKDGKTVFDTDAREFSRIMTGAAERGAHILGGCCGTTPEYIKLLVEATKSIPCKEITEKNITHISSYTHAVRFGAAPVIIGERINPTGKPKLKEALRAGNMDYIITEALREVDSGAEVLDVNVGLPEIDEPTLMCKAVTEIQSVTDLPLQIDSSDPKALEAAMRIYNGKPLVNSVNAKDESLKAILPLVKKYGGTLIALTIGDEGIPENAEERVALAEKIAARALEYGISKKDIIVDPLALSISADSRAARVTLDSVRMLTDRGFLTGLGVSNISFGLPAREKINSAFFISAMTEGLSAAILNPHSEAMMDAHRAYCALAGIDAGCRKYIESVTENSTRPLTDTSKTTVPEITLKYAVRRGMRDMAIKRAEEELSLRDALDLINNEIIPALDEVGGEFESGKAYLPELLASAEAASSAFEVIKGKLPKQKSKSSCTVILATVKGDVHDIGKNIVKVILESYGYEVIDLGKDTPKEKILNAAREHGAQLVGLSALMTTTVPSMKETIELLHKELPDVRVIVGGAVLTAELAKMIGADYYAKDAMETVRIVASK